MIKKIKIRRKRKVTRIRKPQDKNDPVSKPVIPPHIINEIQKIKIPTRTWV